MLNQRYETIRQIGRGSFGTATQVRDVKDGNKIKVVKSTYILNMRPREIVDTVNEALVLVQLDHAHIIKYYESFCDDSRFYIVVEYCEGGDLYQRLQFLSKRYQFLAEEELLKWFNQIVSAVNFIHAKNILHRDIKSLNIFIQNGQLKLGDFGLAKDMGLNNFALSNVGTLKYFSPELHRNEPYDSKSDIWALGILLYEMCTFNFPFDSSERVLYASTPDLPKRYSSKLNFLLKNLLEKKQSNRYSIVQVKNYLDDRQITFEKEIKINVKKDQVPINKLNNRKSVSTFFLNMIDKPDESDDNKANKRENSSLEKDDAKKMVLEVPIVRKGKSKDMLNEQVQTCFTCKNQILNDEKSYQNKLTSYCYHARCIKCAICGSQNENIKFHDLGSKYRCDLCEKKYSSNLAPIEQDKQKNFSFKICFGCKKFIKSNDVPKVLDGDSLKRTWHSECFRCTKCKHLIENKANLDKELNILCKNCNSIERVFKTFIDNLIV